MSFNVEAFWVELQFLRNLKHQNVVKLQEIQLTANGDIDLILDIPFVFSMKNHLSNFDKFSEDLVSLYTYQILKGIKYMHDVQVIHRNLKCSNVLMNGEGEIKISDGGA